MTKCSIDKCENEDLVSLYWNGKPYCFEHYTKFIWEELFYYYKIWVIGEPASERFRYVLGRAYEENYFENIGGSFLSKARVLNRGFNFIKTENGCNFEITRH